MILGLFACVALVLGAAFCLSGAAAGRLGLSPSESVVAGAVLSLAGSWCVAWAVFVTGFPLWGYRILPVLALAGFALGRRGIGRLAGDPSARDLLVGQIIITGWCVAFLAFVRTHSGGPWAGDWFEHWERAKFFLRQWPRDRLFIGVYELPARPPLANTLTAAFMAITGGGYAHFQVITTVLCSLAYLPVALLAGRFGGGRAPRIAALLLMVSPMFMENATFPWTKLQAVFFILCGLYFFLRVREGSPDLGAAAFVAGVALGAAAITHYSSGPYLVVIGAAWCALGFRRNWDGGFSRATAGAAAAGAFLLALWFAWSIREYGWRGTFLSNSSVSMMRGNAGSPFRTMAMNLWYTLVPPQLRGLQSNMLLQSSPWGSFRDQLFVLYQMNLPFAFGSVGWLAVSREALRAARGEDRAFWLAVLGGIILVSFTTYMEPGYFGIAHLCLQSVGLLGLAFLASRWEQLGRGWRVAVAAGCLLDFCLGVVLNFAVEDFAFDRWFHPGMGMEQVSRTYSLVAQTNMDGKARAHLEFLADVLPFSPAPVAGLLLAMLALAIVRARRPGRA